MLVAPHHVLIPFFWLLKQLSGSLHPLQMCTSVRLTLQWEEIGVTADPPDSMSELGSEIHIPYIFFQILGGRDRDRLLDLLCKGRADHSARHHICYKYAQSS